MNFFFILCRYYRTLRPLRFTQIFGRFWFIFRKPKISFCALPSLSPFQGNLIKSPSRAKSLIDEQTFIFLNQTGNLSEVGWHDESRSKLWRYNQHYFDYLGSSNTKIRKLWFKKLIQKWIVDNKPTKGVGWEPYPTSLRIVNWIKWHLSGNILSKEAIHSLVIQTRWLEKRLEWHLLGNHLLTNAKALIFAGVYFKGHEAKRWFIKGMHILDDQIKEQILSDGSHFELSTMYQAIILEDILDLINLSKLYKSKFSAKFSAQLSEWPKIAKKTLTWLLNMSHPDGKIAFFNDAAFGIASSNKELIIYAKKLGIKCDQLENGINDLSESGYVRLQLQKCVLLADLAEIGPAYLPGHAHADTLSFEFSAFGERVFVNSGTSEYGATSERIRQRSTSAHNTVSIDGKNSSEVWSSFRVGHRANILKRKIEKQENNLYIQGTHNGFKKRGIGPLHCREFNLSEESLTIFDNLSKPAKAEARYYLHPNCKIKKNNNFSGSIKHINGKLFRWDVEYADNVYINNTSWHPAFGVSCPNQCLVIKFCDSKCKFNLYWV